MALTKISRGLLNTGISDSSDATAITIDSSEKVGIGAAPTLGALHVTSSLTDIVTFENTDAGTTGAQLILYHNSSSPADGDRVGALNFKGQDDAGNDTTYAGIRCLATDVSNTTEDGTLTFSTTRAGTFTEAMRIDESGNVGIGVTSSLQQLSVTSASGTVAEFLGEGGPHGLRIYGNDGGFGAIGHVSTGSYDMMIDSSGRFGFGSLGAATSAQFMRIEAEFSTNRIMRMANRDNSGNSNTLEVGHADNNEGAHILICYHGNNTSGASGDPYNDAVLSLQVNGNLAIDGSFSPNSDRRLKKDITKCSYGLDAINQLIPRTYKGRDVSKEMMGTQIGLIADEVEGIIPEVVSKFGLKADGSTLSKTIVGYGDEEGTEETFDEVKNISYDRLVVVLTKALQEADTKIEDLKTRIETLEGN